MAISELSAEFYNPSYIEYIYCLRCPITFDIFYVGKTQKMSVRLSQHLSEANQHRENISNKEKVSTIKDIVSAGLIPIVSIIDFTEIRTDIDSFHSAYKEIYWIQFYLKIGWKLTNKEGINTCLDSTYYGRYKKTINNRERPPAHWYYFGVNKKGEDVYDLTRLNNDGWYFITPTLYHKYNPLDNWRFNSKLGICDKVTDNKATNINITEQPKWTKDFAKEIPPPRYFFEDTETDDCDYEPDVIENDLSDFELNNDDEDNECAEIYEQQFNRSIYINSLKIEPPNYTPSSQKEILV